MISDFKDPAMRLFGRTIQLAPNNAVSAEQSSDHNLCYSSGSVSFQSTSPHKKNKNPADAIVNLDPCSPSSILDNSHQSCKSSSTVSEGSPPTLKKPTKILLCPRCNSGDTKFCYFNNYNVKQPRHFCKDCQRYWTAGGSMRKMPVGAGRRKHKQNNNIIIDNSNPNPSCCVHQNPATISFQGYAPQFPVWQGFLPVPLYGPTPYWGWMTPVSAPAELGPDSSLGKHPRDQQQQQQQHESSTVLVPKTLRFDDPSEAAQCSIWTTLGIKNGTSGAFFGGFESKGEESSTSRLLQANPAALSRSSTFHESAQSEIKAGVRGNH